MRRRIETISRGEQNPLFRGRLAKRAAVLSADQPRKRGRSTARMDPSKRLPMLGHECLKLPKVCRCSLLRFAEDDVPATHCNFCQHFSSTIVGDGEDGARIAILLASFVIVLDHPPRPDPGKRKSL